MPFAFLLGLESNVSLGEPNMASRSSESKHFKFQLGVHGRLVVMVDDMKWQLYTLRIDCGRLSLKKEAGVTLFWLNL
jgi:hypothetical protein